MCTYPIHITTCPPIRNRVRHSVRHKERSPSVDLLDGGSATRSSAGPTSWLATSRLVQLGDDRHAHLLQFPLVVFKLLFPGHLKQRMNNTVTGNKEKPSCISIYLYNSKVPITVQQFGDTVHFTRFHVDHHRLSTDAVTNFSSLIVECDCA